MPVVRSKYHRKPTYEFYNPPKAKYFLILGHASLKATTAKQERPAAGAIILMSGCGPIMSDSSRKSKGNGERGGPALE